MISIDIFYKYHILYNTNRYFSAPHQGCESDRGERGGAVRARLLGGHEPDLPPAGVGRRRPQSHRQKRHARLGGQGL